MLTANVLAKKAEVPVYTVRHYTNIGLLNPLKREDNGYKIYKQSDITLMRFITNAKELGFTLKQISQILDEADNGKSPCPLVREIIDRRISETRQQIKNLKQLQKKMESAKLMWEEMEDGMPNGHSVCHLIESFAE
ncbi:MAG: MerR family DNA-binding protein [Acidobacteriota bacterium]|jgi:DNA-binding transcriptional MerR regulator|nr:MerR family DNA-binding protein [Acidobacteriota bacterium]